MSNGDHVTLDAGTGCVHPAPGFGADDFVVCQKYDIEIVVPVDEKGCHTDYAGKYEGMYVDDSNEVILADLDACGALLATEDIIHSYPHCWRCKNPIIFRTTEQWFCSVDALKDDAIRACKDIKWLPGWGEERMTAMIAEPTKPSRAAKRISTGVVQMPSLPSMPMPSHSRTAPLIGTKTSRCRR